MAGQEATAQKNLADAQKALADAKTDLQRQKYQSEIQAAQEGITRSRDYDAQVQKMSQGELLFNAQCARCHTKGWSTLEPSNGFVPMPEPTGSGAFGPSLRDGAMLDQFPGETGRQKQYDWVAVERRGEQGLRRARDLLGPHAALRQHPEQEADRRDHRVRAEPVGAVVHTLSVLAAEGIKNRDLWYPTILGVLVVIAAVGLFVGTPILLLATNMGTRLGFLVGVACLSGLMVLLSLLWLTNPSPVNTLKGRIPAWVAVESIQNGDFAKSKIPAVRDINNSGRAASEADITNLKAAVDNNLILTKNEQTGEILSGAEGKFAHLPGGHRLPRHQEPGDRRRRPLQRAPASTSAAAGRGSTSACTSRSTRW